MYTYMYVDTYMCTTGISTGPDAVCTRRGITVSVASKTISVGFCQASSTMLKGSTLVFTSTCVLKPSPPVEAMYRQLFGMARPVWRFCSIHQRLGATVASGTVIRARMPYSNSASAELVSCTTMMFGESADTSGGPVSKRVALVAEALVSKRRSWVYHRTPSGARMLM